MEGGTIHPSSTKNILALMFFEAIGSFVLVFAWNFLGGQIGLALFVAIMIAGDYSGGHFNPAVTCAIFVRDYGKTDRDGFVKAALIMVLA